MSIKNHPPSHIFEINEMENNEFLLEWPNIAGNDSKVIDGMYTL